MRRGFDSPGEVNVHSDQQFHPGFRIPSGLIWGVGAWGLLFLWAWLAGDDWFARHWVSPWKSGQFTALVSSQRTWGEAGAIGVILAALAISCPSQRSHYALVVVGCLFAAAAVSVVKPIAGRLRPAERDARAAVTVDPSEGGINSSFPSGHVATAAAFGSGLAFIHPALKPIAILACGGTALSRMAEGRHYLSDCLAGAAIGWAMATLIFQLSGGRSRDWIFRSSRTHMGGLPGKFANERPAG